MLGAGLTGLSAALELAKCGVDTVVLERAALADGASGRNGGQALTGVNPSLRRLTQEWGPDVGQSLWDQGARAVDLVESLIQEHNIACDWHRGGHLALAAPGTRLDHLAADAALLQQAHHPVEWLSERDVRKALGFGQWPAALYDPRSATVNPYRLALGLAGALVRAGAALYTGEAPAIESTDRGYRLVTTRGTVVASQVLLATNAWLGETLPTFKRRIHRVCGLVLATPPLPPAVADRMLPGRPAVFEESDRMLYFQKTADDRLVFGGRASGAEPPEAALTRLLHDALPPLAGVTPDTFWRGALAITDDGLPRVGQPKPGLFYGGGYSGHGVALSVWLGRALARWMAGGDAPEWVLGPPPVLWPTRVAARRRFTRRSAETRSSTGLPVGPARGHDA